MIVREKIVNLVNEKLQENMFLVDVTVSPGNVIHVELDCMDGLTIDQCVGISRHIENQLDRDEEDFGLEVSSPGIDQLFKVNRQYHRNVGRELLVTTQQDEELKGKLLEAGESGITLELVMKEKSEDGKRNQMVKKNRSLGYSEIKKAKVIISFK
jgi:ribosome maturation factor RimP